MTTFIEEAKNYKADSTGIISDLEKCPIVDIELHTENATDAEGRPYSYKYVKFNGEKYRVPKSVIEQVQRILKFRPQTKFIKVTKKGSGMATKYDVEPVD